MNNDKLIIFYENIWVGCVTAFAMALFFQFILFFLSNISYANTSFFFFIFLFCVKSFLQLWAVFFIFTLLYTLNATFNKPAAVLDSHGIYVNKFGLIPWSNIVSVQSYVMNFGPNIRLGIGVVIADQSAVYKQAQWDGKLELYWARKYGYYPIKILNISLDQHAAFLTFAKNYTKTMGVNEHKVE